MLRLFGLQGYTGQAVAPLWMIEEQRLLWQAGNTGRDEDKSDLERLREAEREMGMRPSG